ncbi:MAG: DsrE family protein [Clostridiales bacterium]|nr:DsrE family protein [Clostridiales bacterium]
MAQKNDGRGGQGHNGGPQAEKPKSFEDKKQSGSLGSRGLGGTEVPDGGVVTKPRLLYGEDEPDTRAAFAFSETYVRPDHVIVAISSDQIGTSDEKHGAELLSIFLNSLCERFNLPDEVLLYHTGVLLLNEGHPALDPIRLLCRREVAVKACSESLDFYKTKPAEPNVQPVSMSEITRILMRADRVIRP